ncbi:zinc finger protein 271-like [Trichogramma pretiosum]|uniref:zinc finger protein 271-like n=1 Tax=Trichogramma pretiosum TaxID=7493 RepID=UPI000C718A01|nr:zinc finger protein 271-like [Trichogramma pretiosum]
MYESEKKSADVVSGNNLSEHDIVVSDEKQYVSDICQAAFTLESSMITQRDTSPNDKKNYSYACNNCEKKFGQISHLLTHRKVVHEDRKDFQCDKCEKRFGRKEHLLVHQKTVHESRKDYACDNCEKKFGQKPNLLKHQIAVHEGRKDYRCDKCEKKFGAKRDMLIHQQTIHEGRKDSTCNTCEKKFACKSDLSRHQKTAVHEDRKDFQCEKCEKKFGQKETLYTEVVVISDFAYYLNKETAPPAPHGFAPNFLRVLCTPRYNMVWFDLALAFERSTTHMQYLDIMCVLTAT